MKIITVGILIVCFVIPVQLQDMERRKSHSLYFGHSSHLQSVFIGCFLFIRCLLWGLPNSSTRYVDVFSLTWSKSELKLLEVIHVSTYSISCEILTFFLTKNVKVYILHFPEIEMATKEAPAENRQKLVESLISGAVCEKIPPSKLVSQDKLRSSCISLFGESSLKCSNQLIKCICMFLFYCCT